MVSFSTPSWLLLAVNWKTGFEDEDGWLDDTRTQSKDEQDVITEVIQDIEITPEMTPDERLQILRTRYPEFDSLADEFVSLEPIFNDLQRQLAEEDAAGNTIEVNSITSTTMVKARALAAYTATLAMYFALFSSPAQNSEVISPPMTPEELHDHPVSSCVVL